MLRAFRYTGLLAALFIVPLAVSSAQSAAQAAETCHSNSGQYAETRTCVSSVLAPQGRNSYGPDNLSGGKNGAWCEGAGGAGVGQTITLHQNPESVIGSLTFVNGYARTPDLFRTNGRVREARIETSGGFKKTITLRDNANPQSIAISPSKVSWVRLTIVSVYGGARHADTCVSEFAFNHEEFGAPEEERK